MAWPFRRHSQVFGLEIGFETIRLVELSRSGNQILLNSSGTIPITEPILEKDHFKNPAAIAELIKKACATTKPHSIKAKGLVSALPETYVFSKTIKMPKMGEAEYKKAVPLEAAQYLPIPTSDVYIDYEILIVHPDEPMIDLLLVATPKRLVDEYTEIAKMAGLELVALETKAIADGRAIIPPSSSQGLLIAEIGTEITRIAIWEDHKIRLTTTIGIGNNKISEAHGLDITGDKSSNVDFNPECSSTVSPLVDEIVTAIKYHQNRDYQPKQIEKILLCGSGSRFIGLDRLMADLTKIDVEVVAPRLDGKDKLSSSFITAYGLALWRDED